MAEPAELEQPIIVVVMGVSGAGKTTLATRIADRLNWPFVEGDTLHPSANIDKMRSGVPLDDHDRWPWLDAIGIQIDRWLTTGSPGVVTCSALRRSYRQRLVEHRPTIRIVFLEGSKAVLGERLGKRAGHYMPASLLDSQLSTLEMPGDDEPVIRLDAHLSPSALLDSALASIGRSANHA